jgi:ornithine decarboxylase
LFGTGTPRIELDPTAAELRYRRLTAALPHTPVHYTVAANPEPALLRALASAGCRFAVSGLDELRAAVQAGARTTDLVCCSDLHRRADLVAAWRLGVRVFVVSSSMQTRKLAALAPGAAVLCRVSPTSTHPHPAAGSCPPTVAAGVLLGAHEAGLEVAGVSVQTGRNDAFALEASVEAAARTFDLLSASGISPWLVDLGGALPPRLEEVGRPLPAYAATVELALRRHFGHHRPRTILSTGRAIAADAGTLVTTVVSVERHDSHRRVTLDGELCIRCLRAARIRTDDRDGAAGPCALATVAGRGTGRLPGELVNLPMSLAEGDEVRLLSAGACVGCCSPDVTVAVRRPAPARYPSLYAC